MFSFNSRVTKIYKTDIFVTFDTVSLFTTCTDRGYITHTVTPSRLNYTCPHNHIFFVC